MPESKLVAQRKWPDVLSALQGNATLLESAVFRFAAASHATYAIALKSGSVYIFFVVPFDTKAGIIRFICDNGNRALSAS